MGLNWHWRNVLEQVYELLNEVAVMASEETPPALSVPPPSAVAVAAAAVDRTTNA